MRGVSWVVGLTLGFVLSLARCAGPCSPETCPSGCCNAAGTCERGLVDSACGQRGVACELCGTGRRCKTGACETILVDAGMGACAPANCAGCCTSTGNCLVPPDSDRSITCGAGGVSCVVCSGGTYCDDGGCRL